MKRALVIFGVAAAVVATAALVPIGGRAVVGIRYAVPVNNAASECRNTFVAVNGRRLVLDDGRTFLVDPDWSADMPALLADSHNRVRYDNDDGTIRGLQPMPLCGSDLPYHRQLITIPLVRVGIPQYTTSAIAPAREVPR